MPEHSIKGLAVVADHQTYSCDKCGAAVRATGKAILSDPPKHENQCTGCGAIYVMDRPYPITVFYVPGLTNPAKVQVLPVSGTAPDNDFRDPSG